mmetsp:Transcript_17151/g.27382  ORF Transcript_17151/g.27382 Transcript_17151/m.27382 type:complete len:217 (-) Transcript_17151:416-1066(-)|eukprot:CAMPEP_0197072980 /NCGR_PEP_ID=MMETSP1384-20130603/210371_1 /TAXON_ID=29189 /ORGANISM="Ammonia sp." /LENGTH=216 /DNA_ID=CAMNT_0042511805 /DNA_START=120 /DNA_END=770 /DNA_ORIENTATION=+
MSGTKKVLVKIIIIGESGVGKTALLHQYVTGNFIIEHKSTIGADFHTSELNIDEKTITLQIWDTAGQERFQSLGNAFYRGADACILVYAINDDNSFKAIEEWKSKFINQAGIDDPKSYPFLLLGNKADLDNGRAVSQQQGESYARSNSMAFYETSAKNGQNIEDAIKKIASIASDQPTVPFFHEEVVQKAMANYGNDNQEAPVDTASGGGCACTLI